MLWNNKYLLVFLGIFIWVFAWSCAISFYFKAKREDHYQAFVDYVLCTTEAMAATEEEGMSHCVNKDPAPVWLSYVHIINMSNVGTYCFILFGCQKKVRSHWMRVVRMLLAKEFRRAFNLSIERSRDRRSLSKAGSVITGVTLESPRTTTLTS